jgi:hypothetical protein
METFSQYPDNDSEMSDHVFSIAIAGLGIQIRVIEEVLLW